jgi:hypothetical protein
MSKTNSKRVDAITMLRGFEASEKTVVGYKVGQKSRQWARACSRQLSTVSFSRSTDCDRSLLVLINLHDWRLIARRNVGMGLLPKFTRDRQRHSVRSKRLGRTRGELNYLTSAPIGYAVKDRMVVIIDREATTVRATCCKIASMSAKSSLSDKQPRQ